MARSALTYVSRRAARDRADLAWMQGLVRCYPDWGYRLVWGHNRNTGRGMNRQRVHRLWKQARLQQPLRTPARKLKTGARLKPAARIRNQVWCYDFVHDRDATGRMLRCLTVQDEASAYALALVPANRFSGADVQQVWQRLARQYGYPAYLRSDNGGEFIEGHLRAWLRAERITTAYIDPGKPWQNGSSESFNHTFRRGCLNRYEFGNVAEATVIMEQWRRVYNNIRPHSRLGYWPPASAYFLERKLAA